MPLDQPSNSPLYFSALNFPGAAPPPSPSPLAAPAPPLADDDDAAAPAPAPSSVLSFDRKRRKRERPVLLPNPKRTSLVGMLGMQGFARLLTETATGLLQANDVQRARELLSVMSHANLSEPYWVPLFLTSAKAAYLDADFFVAADCLRRVLLIDPRNIPAWNLLNRVMARQPEFVDSFRFSSFRKSPLRDPWTFVFMGHVTTRRWLALKYYLRAFSQLGHTPLLDLSIALVYLGLATSRTHPNPLNTILTAVAWLSHYAQARGFPAEVHYNIGRVFHQIGLSHIAYHHYHQALTIPGSPFTREAAFNLSLLYRGAGSKELARHLLKTYLRF